MSPRCGATPPATPTCRASHPHEQVPAPFSQPAPGSGRRDRRTEWRLRGLALARSNCHRAARALRTPPRGGGATVKAQEPERATRGPLPGRTTKVRRGAGRLANAKAHRDSSVPSRSGWAPPRCGPLFQVAFARLAAGDWQTSCAWQRPSARRALRLLEPNRHRPNPLRHTSGPA